MSTRKIEIERNLIERFLMGVKDRYKSNKKPLIYSFISILIVVALIISGVVYYRNREKVELEQFEKILDRYSTSDQNDLKNIQKTINDLNALIDSSLWGYVNENGYYVVAGLYLSINNQKEGKKYLLKFVDKSPSSFFAPLALHRAGIASEELGDINDAFRIYQRLEKEYQNSIIADEIFYDLGRINQVKGNLLKAKEYYNKVISEYPISVFASKAKKRLLLLGYHKTIGEDKEITM